MDDNDGKYRPHEIPANLSFTGGTGDADGILQGSSGEENTAAFSAVQPYRLRVLTAASNASLAEEQAFGAPGV